MSADPRTLGAAGSGQEGSRSRWDGRGTLRDRMPPVSGHAAIDCGSPALTGAFRLQQRAAVVRYRGRGLAMSDRQQAGGTGAGDDVVRSFARDLARLRELHGSPSFARMQAAIRHTVHAAGSKNTFHRMISSPDRIYEPEFVRGFVLALGLDGAEAEAWEQRRIQALQDYQAQRDAALPDAPADLPARQRRLTLTAATLVLALALALTAASFISGSKPQTSRAHATAHGLPGTAGLATARDGSDPKDSGCALDPGLVTLDSAEVDYQGRPAGLDELRYSPRCGVAWTRFQPFPQARIPRGAIIHTDIFRPGTGNTEEAFQAPYVGAAVYGNVLQSTASCVYAAVTIEEAGKELPESRTHCFRGATPQGPA
jgi:hypothetical protein